MQEAPSPAGVSFVRLGILRYGRRYGLVSVEVDHSRIVADPIRGPRIAAAYMASPVVDPAALSSYRQFARETVQQFRFLTTPTHQGGLGVTVELCERDPYPNADAMMWELAEHRLLRVFATGGPGGTHPVLTDAENNMFRAVHDAFGHAAIGRGFDHHDEEAAWSKHASMYSSSARRAMTTETRGQNCALIYHYGGRRFPEQKAVLLPEIYSDPTGVRLLGPSAAYAESYQS